MNKKTVKEKINGSGHINLSGLYILGAIYCLLMVVLIAVQANVRYTIRDDRLELKPREELKALKERAEDAPGEEPATLLITEEMDPSSIKARNIFVPVLSQMKEPFKECNVTELKPSDIDKYDKIVLAITHYPDLADTIADIKNWVRGGGNLMIAYPPEVSGSFQSMYEILGIKDSGDTTFVEGLHFKDDFMIGGSSRDYPIIDAYDCALGLSLADDCEVYMESTDKCPVPLIFRRKVGEGSVVVDNFGILALVRHAEAVTLSLNGNEAAKHDYLIGICIESAEDYDALPEVLIGYPAEARPVKGLLPELRVVEIEVVEPF